MSVKSCKLAERAGNLPRLRRRGGEYTSSVWYCQETIMNEPDATAVDAEGDGKIEPAAEISVIPPVPDIQEPPTVPALSAPAPAVSRSRELWTRIWGDAVAG